MTLIVDPSVLLEGITLGDLLTRVQRRVGVDFADEHLREVINEALQYVSTQHDWPWLHVTEEFTTTADEATYHPSGRWRRTREVRVDDQTYPAVADVVGDQTGYLAGPGGLILSPTPSGELTVRHRYVRHEVELVADDDITLLPARHAGAVVSLACAYALIRTGDPRSKLHEAAGERALIQMRKEHARAHMAGARIAVRPGYPL